MNAFSIFATCKPFVGEMAYIQENAIRSWLTLEPRVDLVLIGDDSGAKEISGRLGCRFYADVERAFCGAPLFNSLFALGQQLAKHDVVCYLNADLIVLQDFADALCHVAANFEWFLMIGKHWRVGAGGLLDFRPGWQQGLKQSLAQHSKPTALDYFGFRRGLYVDDLPEYAMGYYCWDTFLMWDAMCREVPVVDVSSVVTVVHQEHKKYAPQSERGDLNQVIHKRVGVNRGAIKAGNPAQAQFVLLANGTIQCRY